MLNVIVLSPDHCLSIYICVAISLSLSLSLSLCDCRCVFGGCKCVLYCHYILSLAGLALYFYLYF